MPNARSYTYVFQYNEEDKAVIGRCLEFPSVAAHGPTREDAWDEIWEVITRICHDMEDKKEPLPEPMTFQEFRRLQRPVQAKRPDSCNESPDKTCHYYPDGRDLPGYYVLINKKKHYLPGYSAEDSASAYTDHCIFCGRPKKGRNL